MRFQRKQLINDQDEIDEIDLPLDVAFKTVNTLFCAKDSTLDAAIFEDVRHATGGRSLTLKNRTGKIIYQLKTHEHEQTINEQETESDFNSGKDGEGSV